ncbi:MAG: hypothetical protein NUV98_03195 [Candidatus Roizmanbacteria bacterium]|nr:hypothetical protein [Candidatus Roizmanbacteria bacterium]
MLAKAACQPLAEDEQKFVFEEEILRIGGGFLTEPPGGITKRRTFLCHPDAILVILSVAKDPMIKHHLTMILGYVTPRFSDFAATRTEGAVPVTQVSQEQFSKAVDGSYSYLE